MYICVKKKMVFRGNASPIIGQDNRLGLFWMRSQQTPLEQTPG